MTWNSSLSQHHNPEPFISPRMAELDAILKLETERWSSDCYAINLGHAGARRMSKNQRARRKQERKAQ